jgi:hypothetical protein
MSHYTVLTLTAVELSIAVACNIRQIKTGVPHGSVLSSILFNTSIENMPLEYRLNSSRDNSVSTATGYGLDGWGSIPSRGKKLFSSPQRRDRLWDPLSLLPNMHRGPFLRE